MERSSPARVSGRAFREVTLDGQKYILSQPLKVGSFAEQEGLILSRRLDVVELVAIPAISRLPAHMHASVWEGVASAAARGMASKEEWGAYHDSLWKKAYMLWSTLDPKHKATPMGPKPLKEGVEWALDILDRMPFTQYEIVMQQVGFISQDAALKNSSGPSDQSGTPSMDDPTTKAGPPSMNDLPSDSAGPETT